MLSIVYVMTEAQAWWINFTIIAVPMFALGWAAHQIWNGYEGSDVRWREDAKHMQQEAESKAFQRALEREMHKQWEMGEDET